MDSVEKIFNRKGDYMKLSKPFFHYFRTVEEVRKGVRIAGKYSIAYDYEDGKVHGIYVNTGLDMPQVWELIEEPGIELRTVCKNHLEEL